MPIATSYAPEKPKPIKLHNSPPLMKQCFQLLQQAGADHFALFGGAVRDADYSARYNQPHRIKDYDLRV